MKVNVITEARGSSLETDMKKLSKILMKYGQKSEKGNYVCDRGNGIKAFYNPNTGEITAMDAMWGAPRYTYLKGELFKKNIEGRKATLTKATLIKNVLDQVYLGTKLSDYDDEGNKI